MSSLLVKDEDEEKSRQGTPPSQRLREKSLVRKSRLWKPTSPPSSLPSVHRGVSHDWGYKASIIKHKQLQVYGIES
jgi:hypothetical protein